MNELGSPSPSSELTAEETRGFSRPWRSAAAVTEPVEPDASLIVVVPVPDHATVVPVPPSGEKKKIPSLMVSLEEMERQLYDPSLVSRYYLGTDGERKRMRQLPSWMRPPWDPIHPSATNVEDDTDANARTGVDSHENERTETAEFDPADPSAAVDDSKTKSSQTEYDLTTEETAVPSSTSRRHQLEQGSWVRHADEREADDEFLPLPESDSVVDLPLPEQGGRNDVEAYALGEVNDVEPASGGSRHHTNHTSDSESSRSRDRKRKRRRDPSPPTRRSSKDSKRGRRRRSRSHSRSTGRRRKHSRKADEDSDADASRSNEDDTSNASSTFESSRELRRRRKKRKRRRRHKHADCDSSHENER